ncbi:alpha/beta hydrolase [Sphingosinicella rhizophila]|uniref:Acyl-CoA:diacylglycerol acyltransferase n=1 Tax=Sphingosinicella rhizophila TaxID=3050082 RepID=A0ABU3QC74_9SPHN|nr:alpha/beta hydrolase-fold protein [Sphingosinicella sp. GR2756]MDT9601016.1 alpha/beta hydrolase-fold protein [Sphingosinicella sp. GR2756]
MTTLFDRRETLALAGGLAAAASSPAAARTAAKPAGQFEALPIPHATMFERTRYFEIDSVKAGARYGIWVTVPTAYESQSTHLFPAIYMPDGNSMALLSSMIGNAGMYDPINPVQSSIQIAIGYTGSDRKRSLAVRARDLLPPKEAMPEGMVEGMRDADYGDMLDREGVQLYIQNLLNPAGDRFLAFLTEELHPFIARNYRIQPDTVGLFGHSYGGLFTAYAALQKSTIFKNFGASSPGILAGKSVVFKLYADALESGGLSERNLHLMVGTREITAPTLYQWMVGEGSVEFIKKAGTTPIKGVNFSSHLIDEESHVSLVMPAVFSFLRAFYAAKA